MNHIFKEIQKVHFEILEKNYPNLQEEKFRGNKYYCDLSKDEFLLLLNGLENIEAKIVLAQFYSYRFDLIDEFMNKYSFTESQRIIFDDLFTLNKDLKETLNVTILKPKYAFLYEFLDLITTNIDVQQRILNLSDEELSLFKLIYEKVRMDFEYVIPIIDHILKVITNTPFVNNDFKANSMHDLFHDISIQLAKGYRLTDQMLEKMIYVFANANMNFNLKTLEELESFGVKADDKKYIDLNSKDEELNFLKNAILQIKFGISYGNFSFLYNYQYDFSNIEITEENYEVIELFYDLKTISENNNIEELRIIYNELEKQPSNINYKMISFNSDLKNVFSQKINESISTKNDILIKKINDIEIYDMGTDFKALVTAIGAFDREFEKPENYKQYWNNTSIKSHALPCSLIGNTNFSMVIPKEVVFGFLDMPKHSLHAASPKDLGSTGRFSQNFYMDAHIANKFMDLDTCLDHTRDYNEFDYERRDYKKDRTNYKKNPDYILFIDEYEDADKYIKFYEENPVQIRFYYDNEEDIWGRMKSEEIFEEQYGENSTFLQYMQKQSEKLKTKWQESLKAAKDFNIPIRVVNREKCARLESEKMQYLLQQYLLTHDLNLIPKIFIIYENNRFGHINNLIILNKYFSENVISKILDIIINEIQTLDTESQKSHLSVLKETIENEEKKIKYYFHNSLKYQNIGFNSVKTLQIIKNLEQAIGDRNR